MSLCVRRFVVSSLALALLLPSLCSAKGEVTIDRILREHKVTVATTEPPEKLERYWLNWGYNVDKRVALSDLLLEKDRLPGDGDVLFVIDRSKCGKLDPAIEALFPVPTAALERNELAVVVARDAARLNGKYKNGWLILVSAPDEKWLHFELNRIDPRNSNRLKVQVSATTRSVLDKYLVRRMLVVSTEGRQLPEEWLGRQFDPSKQAFDIEVVGPESLDPAKTQGYGDVLLLLDREKLKDEVLDPICQLVPGEIGPWLRDARCRSQLKAGKKLLGGSDGSSQSISAIVAPCGRFLRSALAGCKSIDAISETCQTVDFQDLSVFRQVLVVAKSADKASEDNSLLSDFGSKATAEMVGNLGLTCTSRQDLKNLIYEGIRQDQDRIDQSTMNELDKKLSGAGALAVFELVSTNEQTKYSAGTPRCVTERYAPFSEPKPDEPRPPDAGERKYGIAGPRIYPDGEKDPKYIERYSKWKNESMPRYREELRQWEREKEQDDHKRRGHDMSWQRSILAEEQVSVRGNLKIYDLRGSGDRGIVVYSGPISGEAVSSKAVKTDTVSVRGEESQPDGMSVPESESRVSNRALISDALRNACKASVSSLCSKSILPTDRLMAVNEEKQEPAVAKQYVEAEAVGATKASQKPTGKQLDDARSAALANALPGLLQSIKVICSNAVVSEEELRGGAKVKSEGWDKAKGEYRVRFTYAGEVALEVPSGGGK